MAHTGGLICGEVYLPEGWVADHVLEFDDAGEISDVRPRRDSDTFPQAHGPVIPGLANLHSHAFQRAMVGLTQQAGPDGDDFWSWRQAVYRFVPHLTPEDVETIATQLYIDMLKSGYTAVGEFHYLHHGPDGAPYAAPAEMGLRIAAAGAESGIGLTLLPVLYEQGGFGGIAPETGQRRYVSDIEMFGQIFTALQKASGGGVRFSIGAAAHSLRAVGPESLAAMLEIASTGDPIHIHIAEQTREVEECVAWCGVRPVEWLLANADVAPHWCLVHATHLTAAETTSLARTGAVAGLCPTTEADLGDGFFPADNYVAAGGRFGVGSDSHAAVDAAEELRLLEYGQRLQHRGRNVLRPKGRSACGEALYDAAARGGGQALGRMAGRIEAGVLADLVVLDGQSPLLAGKSGSAILDTYVFSGGRELVRDVFVAGRQVIASGRHSAEDDAAARYRTLMRRLLAA